MTIEKIISGGQTGADRAGLDAAMEPGIPVGGYCPKGCLAEDGTVPDKYPLIELSKGGYPARTERNVVESDGTLIQNVDKLPGVTKLTHDCTRKHGKPCLVVQLYKEQETASVRQLVEANNIRILNIAGPRESKHQGLHDIAVTFLRCLFQEK